MYQHRKRRDHAAVGGLERDRLTGHVERDLTRPRAHVRERAAARGQCSRARSHLHLMTKADEVRTLRCVKRELRAGEGLTIAHTAHQDSQKSR